jgi:hypothetical protein
MLRLVVSYKLTDVSEMRTMEAVRAFDTSANFYGKTVLQLQFLYGDQPRLKSPGIELGLRGEKPEVSCLNCGTVFSFRSHSGLLSLCH